jgi:hypothetical protein
VGAPKQTISPNTQSVGFSSRLVEVNAITPDGTIAITTDIKLGIEVRVPMLFQRSKGVLPAVGEKWLVAQDITSSYSFAAIMSTTDAPFTSDVVSNGNVGGGGSGGIPGSAIAPGSVTGTQLAPYSIGALNLAAAAFGTNIILDPQFTNIGIDENRLADPGTKGTWNIASPDATASGTALATLALMPSDLVPLYVNQGEQYYLAVQADLSAGSGVTAGIQFFFDNGSFLGPGPTLNVGANTIAQLVTIPPGVASAYVRLFADGLTGSETVTFSSPVCYITQGPNQLQAGAVTANSIAANAVTANAIAANAITAASIAAGAVTAASIQAGTVVAGIVNGTTISGAQFVAYGTTGEILIYSGTPASGNLIASISASAGTDGFGNAYQAGAVTYSGNAYSQLASGVLKFSGASGQYSPAIIQTLNQAGWMDLQSGLVNSFDTTAEFYLNSNVANGSGGSQIVANAYNFIANTTNFAVASGQMTIPAGGGPFIPSSGWTDISNGTGWLARVKLLPWNAVWLDVQVSASTLSSPVDLGSLPFGYYPTSTRIFPLANNGPSATYPRVYVPTSGQLQVNVGGSGAWAGGCSVMYPTN